MGKGRIENNHSYEKLRKEIEGAESLQKLSNIMSFFGVQNNELNEAFSKIHDMKIQLESLAKSPDKFNDYFAHRGFIAHESMDTGLMLESIGLADKGQIEQAEEILIEYYSSEKIRCLLHQLKGHKAFYQRYHLFQLAYEDTLAKRYHAVVPVLNDDGWFCHDIDRQTEFCSNTNLTAWDSIAAHSTGLTVLRDIFGDARHKNNI